MTKNKIKIILIALIILLGVVQGGLILFCIFSDAGGGAKSAESFLSPAEKLPVHASYFSRQEFFDEAYQDGEAEVKAPADFVYGGIVPHHLFVKDKIAAWFAGLKNFDYKTIVIIGPNHFNAGAADVIFSSAEWQTPYGVIEPDRDLGEALTRAGFADEESPFNFEHSVSGLVSFIKHDFPQAKILPVILKFGTAKDEAEILAATLAEAVDPRETLIIASVDFSHYQSVAVADFHDEKSEAAIENFDFPALAGLEIDSPASLQAILKYLQTVGAEKSDLIYHTNSGKLVGDFDSPTTSHHFYYFSAGGKSAKPVFSALFFGDTMIDRNVGARINEDGFDWLFNEIKGEENRFFIGSDLISANLEGTVTNGGAHYPPNYSYDFAFAPDLINGFKKYNFNFFNIANNHVTDQGERGVQETGNNLAALGFNYAGCPDGVADESCAGKAIEINGRKIGMVGLSMVYSNFDLEKAKKIIADLKKETGLVVVNIHWGNEYEHQFNKHQENVGHALIDAGVDVIIGHHPHAVQGMEIYQGKPIFYSLGNFIFDQYFSPDTQEGLAIGLNISSDNMNAYLFPFKSTQSQPKLLQGEEKKDFLAKFTKWSRVDKIEAEEIKQGTLKLIY